MTVRIINGGKFKKLVKIGYHGAETMELAKNQLISKIIPDQRKLVTFKRYQHTIDEPVDYPIIYDIDILKFPMMYDIVRDRWCLFFKIMCCDRMSDYFGRVFIMTVFQKLSGVADSWTVCSAQSLHSRLISEEKNYRNGY